MPIDVSLWFYVLVFFFGASLGSFANVLIDRVPVGKSIWFDRSECDYCHKTLRWFELIPLISFIFQKGRCVRCKKELSWQYPTIELLMGMLITFFVNRILTYHSPIYYDDPSIIVLLFFIIMLVAIAI